MLEPGWIVVTTRPMAEEVAEQGLKSAGWRVYLPRGGKLLRGIRICPETGRRIRTRGLGSPVLRPVFTGYIFVELHPNQEWGPILERPAVYGILRRFDEEVGGLRPILMSQDGIDRLRLLEDGGSFDEPRCARGKHANLRPDLEEGIEVSVEIAGISLSGFIEQLSSKHDRAIVSYMLFGRNTRSWVGTEKLEVVAA